MPRLLRRRVLLSALAAALAVPATAAPALATDPVVVVRPGDTLSELAARHGTTVARLTSLNGIRNPNRIYAGQRLRLPASEETGGPSTSRVHVVAPGETLWGIARRHQTSVTALAAANHIARPSLIHAGQRLLIPPSPVTGTAPTSGSTMPSFMRERVAARAPVGRLIAAEAARYGVPDELALAVAWQESGWRQEVVSRAGAIGIMQLMPATADWIAAALLGEPVNVHDARWNVRAGVRLLRHYLDRYGGSRELALAAYYQGQRGTDLHGVYPVSRPYVASVLALERTFRDW